MRALVLVNRHSRSGAEGAGPALARLEAAGWRLLLPEPERPEDLPRAVREAAGRVDLVIAAGGDGTLHAILDALVATGLPLGILPLGTGNDLARTLGIPPEPEAAAAVLLAGRRRRIDLGRVNGIFFANVAGIGLGVEVTRALTRERKRRLGPLAWPLTLLQVVRDFRPFRARIRCEDGEMLRVWAVQIAVGNGRHYGGGMVVHEEAGITDGLLHLHVLRARAFWRLALQLPRFLHGIHDDPRVVRARSGQRFEIVTRPARSVTADGEIVTRTPALFEVVPRALEVYVPAAETGETP